MQFSIGEAAATPSTSTDAANGASTGGKARDAAAGAGGQADIPLHLTEKILSCVSPLESARLATVCKSWADTVSSRLARPVPHLFICMPPNNTSDRRGIVVSVPLDDCGAFDAARLPPAATLARVRSADTNGLGCIGATRGGRLAFAWWWNTSVVLVNPVTGVLRSIDMDSHRDRVVWAAGGCDSFFSIGGDGLVLWRLAGGNSEVEEWSKQAVAADAPRRAYDIESAVICNDCFYVLHADGHMSVIDVAAVPPPLLRMEKLPVASLVDQVGALLKKGHLLESDGQVLFVRKLLVRKEAAAAFCRHGNKFLSIVGFEVYRLDVEDRRWTKVEKLAGDDRALFVSPDSSFAVRASETSGCRSNCIYFVGEKMYCSSCHADGGNAWGVYSMEDRQVLFEHAVTGPGSCTAALWFLPSVI